MEESSTRPDPEQPLAGTFVAGSAGGSLEPPELPGRERRWRSRPLSALLLLAGALGAWQLWEHRSEVAASIVDPLGVRLVEGHAEIIREAARESRVDPNLLAAIMFMESRGRVGSRSSADALGLMQLQLSAAADAAERLGLPEPGERDLLTDARLNVRLGARHLAWLLDNSEGWPLERVLVSYNAGRTKLYRWIRAHGGYDAWRAEEERRAAAGERTTGTLDYARRALTMRERFRERGLIEGPGAGSGASPGASPGGGGERDGSRGAAE